MSTQVLDAKAFELAAQTLDEAITTLESLSEDDQAIARAALDALEKFYSAGIAQLVRILRDQVPNGAAALSALAGDPMVRALFLSTGVLRPGPTERAERALDRVRPYISSHGGEVEIVKVDPPVAYLRFGGACQGCHSATATLEDVVSGAILSAVEELERIETVDPLPTEGDGNARVALLPTRRAGGGWAKGPLLSELPEVGVVSALVEERDLLFVASGDSISCFENACAHMGMPLDRATLDKEGTLQCPWHGFTYDARTGECINLPGVQLPVHEVKVSDGRVMVRLETR